MSAKAKTLAVLFTPFLLNLIASMFAYSLVPRELWAEPMEAMKVLYSLIFSYQSAFMILIQVSFGLYLFKHTRGMYDFRWRDLLLALGLVIFAFIVFFLEGTVSTLIYGMNSSEYREWYGEVVRMTPVWAKYMNALVAPFTAGVFEEVMWRGYGITKLEDFTSTWKAVVVQAVAFSIWHVSPIHVIFVLPIGLIYGYAFVKRRSLIPLMLAHVITDLIGFSSWLLYQ